MPRERIHLKFNPDTMTVSDLKAAVGTLNSILQDFDAFSDMPEEFTNRVLQVRDAYYTSNQMGDR